MARLAVLPALLPMRMAAIRDIGDNHVNKAVMQSFMQADGIHSVGRKSACLDGSDCGQVLYMPLHAGQALQRTFMRDFVI